jgi:hypothetical protein
VRPSTTSAGTSLDNMSSSSPFIHALASIPVAPENHAHSIVPVKGDGPAEKGDDGVVKYSSAHNDGVESELVIRSGHSVHSNSEAIEEVRRILLLHMARE